MTTKHWIEFTIAALIVAPFLWRRWKNRTKRFEGMIKSFDEFNQK